MKIFTIIILFLFNAKIFAQNITTKENNGYYVELSLLSLRSTHGNYFNGGTYFLGKNFTKKFNVGIGFEHSRNKFHNDNDWLLYNLRFRTLVLREEYVLFTKGKFIISADMREGFSFVKYLKEEPLIKKNYRYQVRESGLYLYVGLDSKVKINEDIAFVTDVGIKGLHISSNVYEVNPHGINVISGVQIKF